MIDFIQNFHFIRPWLLLFLLIPFVLFLKKIKTNQSSSWEEICDKHLLDFLIVNEIGVKKINFKKYIYIGLIVACISAAGPSWKKIELPAISIENPNMFVLSLAQDMQLSDVSPSRLDRAKYIISDIADSISVQGQYGLMVYSEEPYLVSPITDDANLIKSLLHQIVPDVVPDNGDRLDRAISLAIEHFKSAGYSKGNIILLCSDVGQRFDLALEKANSAVSLGYNINIIDISYDGNDKLKRLANNGRGVYLRVFDQSISPLLQKITQINNANTQVDKNLRSIYLDFGYYLVFIPIICLLFFFRKGIFILVLCFISFNAHAGFLLNNNQEGFNLFKHEKYELAKDKFDDVNWQGISLYMLNQHEEALDKFDKIKSSDGFYNKGVTLVKLCKYNEALEAFRESFKIDSNNEDAKYNIEILENLFAEAKENPSLLECQNDNQQQNQDNNKNENQEKQNNDNNDENNSQENENNSQENDKKSSDKEEKNQSSDNNDSNDNNNNEEEEKKQNQNKDTKEQKDKDNSKQNDDKKNDASNKNNSEDKDNSKSNSKEKSNQSNQTNKNSKTDEETQQNANSVQMQEGNNNEKYDEEAMVMQRLYREIPEDVGGLLREFIKKEYLKDRYNNENF